MLAFEPQEREDLDRALKWLEKLLGPRLVSVVLYGSRARRDHRADSDYDLLVIAEGLPDDLLERDRFFVEGGRPEVGVRIGLIAKSPELFETYLASLYLDIALDGIILYDPRGYAAEKLARILEIIEEAGLYREEYPGSGFLWDWVDPPPPGHWSIEWDTGLIRDDREHAKQG